MRNFRRVPSVPSLLETNQAWRLWSTQTEQVDSWYLWAGQRTFQIHKCSFVITPSLRLAVGFLFGINFPWRNQVVSCLGELLWLIYVKNWAVFTGECWVSGLAPSLAVLFTLSLKPCCRGFKFLSAQWQMTIFQASKGDTGNARSVNVRGLL